jgi:hypothetical protein
MFFLLFLPIVFPLIFAPEIQAGHFTMRAALSLIPAAVILALAYRALRKGWDDRTVILVLFLQSVLSICFFVMLHRIETLHNRNANDEVQTLITFTGCAGFALYVWLARMAFTKPKA